MKQFLEFEAAYEEAYFRGDLEDALVILDSLEEALGLSFWLIAKKTLVMRRLHGSAEQEKYTSSLIGDDPDVGLNGYIAYLLSIRADPDTTYAMFKVGVSNSISKSNLPAYVREFLAYQVLPGEATTPDSFIGVLASGETSPIVDRYLAVVHSCQHVLSDGSRRTDAIDLAMAKGIRQLLEFLDDERLENILEVLCHRNVSQYYTHAYDLYTTARYDEAAHAIVERLTIAPRHVELYELLARAEARCASTTPGLPGYSRQIVQDMAAVYTRGEDFELALSRLEREALFDGSRTLSTLIRAFLTREASASEKAVEAYRERLAALELITPSPLHIRVISELQRQGDALRDRRLAAPTSPALKLQLALRSKSARDISSLSADGIPDDRIALYAGRLRASLGEWSKAEADLQELLSSAFAPLAYAAAKETFTCLLARGSISEALLLAADWYIQNKKLYSVLDVAKLLQEVKHSGLQHHYSNIALSICIDIYTQHVSGDYLGERADAAEEYLQSVGCDLPSELRGKIADHDIQRAIYFLRNVCVTDVIDQFVAIETADEVELERIAVCQLSSELDDENRQVYVDEIRDITRRRVVRARMAQVERTKIYVDIAGIKRQADKSLKDTYSRFIASLSNPELDSTAILLLRQVKEIVGDLDGINLHIRDIPSNQRDQLFERLVTDVARMLVSGREYGLEAYLSTRVRHGTLANQLRSAFEVNSLLTRKDAGRYAADTHWADVLRIIGTETGARLAERLATFSMEVDGLIEDLARSRVQVLSDEKPLGLFVLATSKTEILTLQTKVDADTSFDQFIDLVVGWFWRVLDHSLERVRRYLLVDFKSAIFELLNGLEGDVQDICSPYNHSQLSTAISAARVDLGVTISNVASWFEVSREIERPDYDFYVAVEVALQSVNNCYRNRLICLERGSLIQAECRGKTLEDVVYILFTVFDNAVKYCGFDDRGPNVSIFTTVQDGWLEIIVENDCAVQSDYESKNAELARLRETYGGESAQTLVTVEGRSGYPKILKILKYDLLTKYSVNYGYVSPTRFRTSVGMELKAVVR